MISKLEAAGGHPPLDDLPESGHDCWEAAYGEGELFHRGC